MSGNFEKLSWAGNDQVWVVFILIRYCCFFLHQVPAGFPMEPRNTFISSSSNFFPIENRNQIMECQVYCYDVIILISHRISFLLCCLLFLLHIWFFDQSESDLFAFAAFYHFSVWSTCDFPFGHRCVFMCKILYIGQLKG